MRADDTEELLAGYVSGPAAATEATLAALPRAAAARAVVLVEGVSDQIAVETLAARHGRDLTVEGIVVLPTGGVHGMARYLRRFGPEGSGARLAGLCDAAEEHIIRRGLGVRIGYPGPWRPCSPPSNAAPGTRDMRAVRRRTGTVRNHYEVDLCVISGA